MLTLLRPNWIEIDRNALVHNVQLVRTLIGPDCLLMAVVKANAYGHGAVETGHILLKAGADRLAVATLSEGVELRQAGIQAPILVLGYTPGRLAEVAISHRITVAVYDLETAQAFAEAATLEQPAVVHVKINTGMNRLGLLPAEAPNFLKIYILCPAYLSKAFLLTLLPLIWMIKTLLGYSFTSFSTCSRFLTNRVYVLRWHTPPTQPLC